VCVPLITTRLNGVLGGAALRIARRVLPREVARALLGSTDGMVRTSPSLVALASLAFCLLLCSAARAEWPNDDERAQGPGASAATPVEPIEVREEERVRFDHRPFGLQLRLGFATSVGLAGVVGEYDVADWINVGAGLGTNALGPIGGAHVRLRPAVLRTLAGGAAHAFVIETALSRGRYQGSIGGIFSAMCEGSADDPRSNCYDPPVTTEWVWWGQAEIGWEFRGRSGFVFRATTGVAGLLGTPEWKCTLQGKPAPCGRHLPEAILPGTLTLALGYAF
jgi:hypothetical protein